jgi:hypothetical protein
MDGIMKIKKVAFGNLDEAFIESRFTDKVNLIYSKANNKGKTLLIQGLMYSIGNEPIFPSGFDYREFYFYSQVSINHIDYHFLRKGNSILIKSTDFSQVCGSVTEFKHFLNKNVIDFPSISKDNKKRLVEPHLFYELFFLGQDDRIPSNLIIKGQYNKADFISMVCSIFNIEEDNSVKVNIQEEKNKLASLKDDLKGLKRKLKIAKQHKKVGDFTQKTIDREQFEKRKEELEKTNKNILELKKTRNREFNRKIKLENLLLELKSLNQNLKQGEIQCGECGSDKIIFSNDEFNFEVSNKDVRSRITKSIIENIEIKEEIINEFDIQIEQEQKVFNKQLEVASPELGDYILFKDEVIESSSIDSDIVNKQLSIDRITKILSLAEEDKKSDTNSKAELIKSITDEMNAIYKMISPNGNLSFEDLFAKKDQTFSGSSGQEFYFSKLVALKNILKHEFPIVNDSFRDGEISSDKERLMLEIYEQMESQVILTSTLKEEEYASEKYKTSNTINVLDYNENGDSKILNKLFSKEFNEILNSFDLKI